jgi:uncharacterized membrane protein
MQTKDIVDMFLSALGKVEFYWNFYTVTVLALIGWMASTKAATVQRLRLLVLVGFCAFSAMNLLGLHGSYLFTESLQKDLIALGSNDSASANLKHTSNLLGRVRYDIQRIASYFIHLVVGVLFAMALFSKYSPWLKRNGEKA